ncbi:MAG: hypothetical protein QM484_13705 [Woeseiaceae bacterium]
MIHTELTLFDQISLGLALLFVIVFTIIKIRGLLNSSSGACGNCTGGQCNAPLTEKRLIDKKNINVVPLSSIHKKSL